MWNERRRMDPYRTRSGWQIAEVQRLIGLSRRDIQRACYEGDGGTGLVRPQDSSWGKRSYSADDLALLFAVKQQHDEGLSLPEVSRLLEAARTGEGGWACYESDQMARMRERGQDTQQRLAHAEALHAATDADGGTTQLDACIYTALLQSIVDGLHDTLTGSAPASRMCEALAWLAGTGADALAALWEALATCRTRELAPHDAQTQQALERALREAASDDDAADEDAPRAAAEGTAPRECGTPRRTLLEALLETADIELALELRLGPGGFAYALEALGAPGQTDTDA